MQLRSAFAVLLLAFAAGCAANSGADDQSINQSASQAAQKRLDDYVATALADKVDQLGDYWTSGAKVYEPESSFDGRAAMMAMVSDVMKSMKFSSATLKITDAFAHDRGTVVYQYGNIDETLTPRDGAAPPTHVRMFLTIRGVKEADGVWRMDRFMETPMPPLPTPAKGKA